MQNSKTLLQDGLIEFNTKKTIWFDFENAPHVWVLKPLYEYFKAKGFECICSARNFSYTLDLLKKAGIKADSQNVLISKNKLIKIFATIIRAFRLAMLYKKRKIDLALSHGSRSQILASKILRVPAISLDDYEKSDQLFVRFTYKLLVPSVINKSCWGRYQDKIEHYPGFKEQIYIFDYNQDEIICEKLQLDKNKIIILLRPEMPTSHYYNRKSTILLWNILEYLIYYRDISVILIPRNKRQAYEISNFFNIHKIHCIIPDPQYFGFEIVTTADLVIGGGGTMLRESACLGIPAYSYFSGLWGDVDNHLLSIKRLIRIESEEDIKKIQITKRTKNLKPIYSENKEYIIKYLEDYLYDN